MRLIDADALPVVTECCMDEAGYLAKFNVVHEEDIKKATTIEAEPVKHGEWEEKVNSIHDAQTGEYYDEGYFVCSVCGYEFWDSTNYCPNCGAKMQEADK